MRRDATLTPSLTITDFLPLWLAARVNIIPSGACTVSYELDLPMLRKGEYFLTAAISIGSMMNHVHLVWDDLAIQLHGESDTDSDGVFYCPTRLEVQ